MKSLKQLWNIEGKPFWAKWEDDIFYCVGISPRGTAIGWNEDGDIEKWSSSNKQWVQIDDPNKPKPKMRVWQSYDGRSCVSSEMPSSIIVDHSREAIDGSSMKHKVDWTDITDLLREALKE